MKDIIGNELNIGDTVAFDVLSNKDSYLRVGEITEASYDWRFLEIRLKVSYTVPQWNGKHVKRSVFRRPNAVAKIAKEV